MNNKNINYLKYIEITQIVVKRTAESGPFPHPYFITV